VPSKLVYAQIQSSIVIKDLEADISTGPSGRIFLLATICPIRKRAQPNTD